MSQVAKIARSASLRPSPSLPTSPVIVVMRRSVISCERLGAARRVALLAEPVEGVVLEQLLLRRAAAAFVRWPSRTSRTSSQSGTPRSSRSTSAVPTNPVEPVMAMRLPASDSAITMPTCLPFGRQSGNVPIRTALPTRPCHRPSSPPASASSTPPSTCSVRAGSTPCRSTRSPARSGVRKQTVLYWFPSKDELVDAVLEIGRGRAGGGDRRRDPVGLGRPARTDRRRGAGRVPARRAAPGAARVWSARSAACPPPRPIGCGRACSRWSTGATGYLSLEMDKGHLRRADPGLDRGARLRHGHRHRHRTRGPARRRLAPERRRPAPPPRRAARVPACRLRSVTSCRHA